MKKYTFLISLGIIILLSGLVFIINPYFKTLNSWMPKSNLASQRKLPNSTYKLPQNNDNQELRLLFFGDLMLDRQVAKIIEKNGLDSLLSKLNEDEFTKDYDLVGANLEGAVTNNGEHYKPDNIYDFAFKPELIAELKNYGFNFFTVANNHLADQGIKGIEETYQNLSDLDFYYLGCQDRSFKIDENNLASSSSFLSLDNCSARVVEIKGNRLIFLAFSIVYGAIDENLIIEKIEFLRQEADWLIVLPHWGIEYQSKAALSQERLAKKMIEAGADLIIGSHPHVIQNYEIYQNKAIFYSLGNFIFDQYFSPETQEGLAVSLTLNKNHYPEFELYKIMTKNSQVVSIKKLANF